MYGYDQIELKPLGADILVTIENVEDYIDLVTEFCMGSGIRLQLDAFRGTYYVTTVLVTKVDHPWWL